MVEHAAVNRRVVGSSPTSGANSLLAHKKGLIRKFFQRPEQQNRPIWSRFGPALRFGERPGAPHLYPTICKENPANMPPKKLFKGDYKIHSDLQ